MAWVRLSACAVLLASILAPRPGHLAGSPVARAAGAPAVVLQVGKRTFDPAAGQDTIARTFRPQSSTYLIDVEMVSSDPSDEVFVQLGDSQQDVTQVQSGEDRFFVASHLQTGRMPTFRVIADPHHDYGNRRLWYAAVVLGVPSVPFNVDGVAMSTIPNVLAFIAPRADTYAVHYHLETD